MAHRLKSILYLGQRFEVGRMAESPARANDRVTRIDFIEGRAQVEFDSGGRLVIAGGPVTLWFEQEQNNGPSSPIVSPAPVPAPEALPPTRTPVVQAQCPQGRKRK